MSDLTNYAEGQFMDWSFLGEAMPTAPDPVYVALHTADPTNAGTEGEVSAGDYSRQSVATTDWSKSGSGPTTIENDAEVSFGVATSSWGTITHFSIWDAETAGNPLWSAAVTEAKEITEDDEARFPIGSLTAEIN